MHGNEAESRRSLGEGGRIRKEIQKVSRGMSNNNQRLFRKVKELGLPRGEYALFGSAPMGIRGIKECNDVDIIVTEKLWQEYLTKPGWEYTTTENGVEHIESTDDDIEIWRDWQPWYQDITQFIDTAEMTDDLPFVKLEYVLEWKRKFGRKKDLRDVAVIEDFLRV